MANKKKNSAIIGIGIAALVAAGIAYALKKKACEAGETRTKTCSDGSVIVTHRCVDGKFTATGEKCPTIPTPSLLIVYCSDDDYDAAKLIWDSLYDIWEEVALMQGSDISKFEEYDMVVIVGADQAWQGCSQDLYSLVGFVPPTQEKNRCLRHGSYADTEVFALAGYSADDTSWLANLFQTLAKQGTLPTITTCY